jgi:hypothetical protein
MPNTEPRSKEEYIDKLIEVVSKIRTPLTLSGLVIIALIIIVRSILDLDIFNQIGGVLTFQYISLLTQLIFGLAFLAVVLGVLSYLIMPILKSIKANTERNSKLEVVDIERDEKLDLIGFELEGDNRSYRFPAYDFKFLNYGNVSAVLKKFIVEVEEVGLDPEPVLYVDYIVQNNILKIGTFNAGWGPAKEFSAKIQHEVLANIFGENLSSGSNYIEEYKGEEYPKFEERKIILDINVDEEAAQKIGKSNLLININEYLNMKDADGSLISRKQDIGLEDGEKGILVEDVKLNWSYKDINGNERENSKIIASSSEDILFLTERGFISFELLGRGGGLFSQVTYVCIIDDYRKGAKREYNISRIVDPGGAERFHIAIGATKSCIARIVFSFIVDKNTLVKSDTKEIHIWSPKFSSWEYSYRDGMELESGLARLEEEYRHGRLGSAQREELSRLRQQVRVAPFLDVRARA